MPPSSTGRLRRFVIGFWVVNLLVALLVVAAWFWMNKSAKSFAFSPAPSVPAAFTLAATPTSSPTPTQPTHRLADAFRNPNRNGDSHHNTDAHSL